MNLEACTEAIRSKVGTDSGLAATLKMTGDMSVAMRLQRVI